MKYPSVFIAILLAWIASLLLAWIIDDTRTTLYFIFAPLLFFSLALFIIGFWRNK